MEHRAELTVLKQFLTGELEYSPEFISIIFSLLDIFQNSFAGRLFRFFSSMKVKHRTAFRRAAGGIAVSFEMCIRDRFIPYYDTERETATPIAVIL